MLFFLHSVLVRWIISQNKLGVVPCEFDSKDKDPLIF